MRLNKIIDNSVEFFFSKNNSRWVLLLFIVGLILRILAADRLPFNADEMVHGTHAIGFIESGKLQIMDQDAVWFWLTDLSTKIFGANMIGLRLLSILFGSLLIILVYLVGKESFSEKVGLVAAAIITFSPFQLTEVRAEMDTAMIFFCFLAIYCLILFFKTDKNHFFVLGWTMLGIAIMVKQIAILFIPAFVFFMLYYNKKNLKSFRIKQIFYAALIILLIVTPVLTFNYLLYKDKGLTDLQFARFTNVSFEYYSGIAPTIQPFSLNAMLLNYDSGYPGFFEGFLRIFRYENIIVFFLFLFGLLLLTKSKSKFSLLLFLSFIFPYLFLAGTSLLPSHLVFATPFIALFSSLSLTHLPKIAKFEKNEKNILYLILIIILILSLIKVQTSEMNGFFGKNEVGQLVDFKEKEISPNSLVIVDSRIYRGRTAFIFWDRYYLESTLFPEISTQIKDLQGDKILLDTYFIECVNTDCGWGTVSSQPDFNKTSNEIALLFKSSSKLVETINDTTGSPYFNVYRGSYYFNSALIPIVDSTHEWFYYPVNYKPKEKIFDNYDTYNVLDSLINKIAKLILYLEVLIALCSIFLLLYLFYDSSKKLNLGVNHETVNSHSSV